MKRFIKTIVPSEGYQEVKKIGNEYILHLEGESISEEEIMCYETIEHEGYDINEIKSELAEWKAYISQVELKNAKDSKIKEIYEYDSSDAVNSFTYHGVEMWLDKQTRNGLIMRLNAEKSVGKTETTLWFGTLNFTLGIDDCLQLLTLLEVYASSCYDNTARHIAAVEALTDIEDVVNYNYTVGYPEKIDIEEVLS